METHVKSSKRQPKQARSRQIVDAVLDGATRILSRARLKETTTNKIAEYAGVGIGSLYDYFPNKEAIVVSLMDRHIGSLKGDFVKMLEGDGRPIEAIFPEVAAFIEDRALRHKDFLREIFYLAPATGRVQLLIDARMEAAGLVAKKLIADGYGSDEAERKSFLLVHGIVGLMDAYIMAHPPQFNSSKFASDLQHLMFAILKTES